MARKVKEPWTRKQIKVRVEFWQKIEAKTGGGHGISDEVNRLLAIAYAHEKTP